MERWKRKLLIKHKAVSRIILALLVFNMLTWMFTVQQAMGFGINPPANTNGSYGGFVSQQMESPPGFGPGAPYLVQAQSYSLSVPYHSQIKTYYCGEAALEMAFDYCGPDISQYEIADVARAQPGPGTYTDDMRRAGHFSNMSTSQGNDEPSHTCTGYSGRDLGYASYEYWFSQTTRISQLKTLIDQGYPIAVLTWYDSSHTNGHYRVAIGYDSSGIIAHDPWDGANRYYSNSLFTDLWSYSSYWGMFTSPWRVSINAPNSVAANMSFMVDANVTYQCPDPFGMYHEYPADSCKATIQLPPGISLASGETQTKSFSGLQCKSYAIVSWDVIASSAGSYSITVNAEGMVHGSVSAHGSYPAYSYNDRIGGAGVGSVIVLPGYPVTFSHSGLDSTVLGTVLEVNGSAIGYSQLPYTIMVCSGNSITYSYVSVLSSSSNGKQFRLSTVSGPTSPLIVNGPANVTGNYVTQYSLTFTQTGLSSDATGTVVTVNSVAKTFADLPFVLWVDSGSSVTYSYNNLVLSTVSAKRFQLVSVTGPPSPIVLTGAVTVTGSYKTQYQVMFDQTGVSSDFGDTVVVIDDSTNYNVTQLPVSFWWDTGSSHTFAFQSPLLVTPDAKQYVWISTTGSASLQSGSIVVSQTGNITGDFKTQFHLSVKSDYATPSSPAPLTLYEYYDSPDTGQDIFHGTTLWAEVFTPSISHYIEIVSIKCWAAGGNHQPGTIYVSIRACLANGQPADDDLCNGTLDGNSINYWSYRNANFYNITMSPCYFLNAGKKYAIVVKAPNASLQDALAWNHDDNATYSGGNTWNNGGGGWSGPVSHYVNLFREYGVTTHYGQGWYDSGTTAYAALEAGLIDHGNGTRRLFIDWGGDATGANYTQSNPIPMDGPKTAVANWKTQYQVMFDQTGVGSDVSGTVVIVEDTNYNRSALPVSFWWDSGSSQMFAFSPSLVVTANAKQYVWTSSTGLSTLQSGSITVTASGSVTGNYKTQYYLTVSSPYDSPTPTSDWFDAGTTIMASVTSPVSGPSGTRYMCTDWSGIGSVPASGSTTTVTFTLNAPSAITWNWKTQYYLTVRTDPTGTATITGEGWYNLTSSVVLTAPRCRTTLSAIGMSTAPIKAVEPT